MQNFDPNSISGRLARLEKIILGHKTPEYVGSGPTAENPTPPIKQVPLLVNGQPQNDPNTGQPRTQDAHINHPGLLDIVSELHSEVHGVKPTADEGSAVNPITLLANQ